jgi:lysophospholipase
LLDVARQMMTPAPLFAVAEGPEGGVAHWLTARDGVRIRVGVWGHDAPKGTVLLFPGRTEFIEKYGRAAVDLLARGYATLSVDWRGQGLAARLQPNPALGHVADFTDYQQDVAAVMDYVRAQNLPRPYYLLAHSMGGCIGLRSLNEGLAVKAVCFTAPMWGIKLAAPLRPVAWALSGLSVPLGFSNSIAPSQSAKTYVLRAGFRGNDLTSDPEMFAYMQGQCQAHPELSLGGPSLRWLNAALRETLALSQGPAPALPCLTLLGTAESIIDVPRVKQRMATWAGGELVLIPGSRHEVMMETPATRKLTFDRACALFEAHR